ncbi:hydrolase [Bacillus cereus]|nr:hydrolase [Bacillus cereus]
MANYICNICGVQYPKNEEAPYRCKICNDERQYVNPIGQSWTTLETMQNSNLYKKEEMFILS